MLNDSLGTRLASFPAKKLWGRGRFSVLLLELNYKMQSGQQVGTAAYYDGN